MARRTPPVTLRPTTSDGVAGQPVGFQAGLYAGQSRRQNFIAAAPTGTDEVPEWLRLMTQTHTRLSYEGGPRRTLASSPPLAWPRPRGRNHRRTLGEQGRRSAATSAHMS